MIGLLNALRFDVSSNQFEEFIVSSTDQPTTPAQPTPPPAYGPPPTTYSGAVGQTRSTGI